MLYLAIDQHLRQLTINLRGEDGDVILQRQVSTEWEKAEMFFQELRERSKPHGGYVTMLEVCGFNTWLLKLLPEVGCRETIVIQPEKQSKQKSDRRDANTLGEILWVNRERFLAGKRVQGVRRVYLPSGLDQEARQLTTLWVRATAMRTRTINRVRHIVGKHNLQHGMPTKGIQTKGCLGWLKDLPLPAVDRLEMDLLLTQWEQANRTLEQLGKEITAMANQHESAIVFRSIPGAGAFTALALACRMSDGVGRFARARSLSNYWGLTPGCRNSGEATQRLGSITKVGSRIARMVLGQLVLHVLRGDRWMLGWYQRIKRRRGSKIAQVAVMRRLSSMLLQMASEKMPYIAGGPEMLKKHREYRARGGAAAKPPRRQPTLGKKGSRKKKAQAKPAPEATTENSKL
jgi:transposase